jgi:hypothetical protein
MEAICKAISFALWTLGMPDGADRVIADHRISRSAFDAVDILRVQDQWGKLPRVTVAVAMRMCVCKREGGFQLSNMRIILRAITSC